MPEEEKEVGVQEEGKPVEEPASKPTEQAEDDGVVTLDTAKKYRSKRNPAREITGADLWAGFGRGERFDKLQSEHQKLQTDSVGKDDQIVKLQAQVSASQVKEQATLAYKELASAGGRKPTAEQDDWVDEESASAPADDPGVTASRIEQVTKETVEAYLDNLTPELEKAATGVGLQQQQERDLQAQRHQTTAQLKANEVAGLRVEFPDASDAEIEDLASRTIQYTGHLISAVDKYTAQNPLDGNEALFDGQDVLKALVKKRTELAQKQATITAKRESDAELEGLNAGVLPGEDAEPVERKTSFKKGDVEKNRETGLARAKKIVDRVRALKDTGM